ncbi:MAG: hypothetical protein OXQ31_23120 [Spirochaetaceae bacterium]|nr:hypothetical protein [Spirochaetaceae bacterium]
MKRGAYQRAPGRLAHSPVGRAMAEAIARADAGDLHDPELDAVLAEDDRLHAARRAAGEVLSAGYRGDPMDAHHDAEDAEDAEDDPPRDRTTRDVAL